jgi:uncharacterized coiled-coil protein SlyX
MRSLARRVTADGAHENEQSPEKRSLQARPRRRFNHRRRPWTSAQVEDIELTAGLAPMEHPMEARIARLEADVAHLRTDVADIKVDVRSLRDKMDAMAERFDAKLDTLQSKFDNKFTWGLSLQIAFAVGILGAMARGFGWL